ncbi:MAG: hypothetical protein MUE42_06355 [Opitutaceae bacterium]|nr:hypothetical protein [Opitutaceae bacterium]
MPTLTLPEYPAHIAVLVRRLEELEPLLGQSSASADLEEVVALAHELRSQLTLYHLARHLDGHACLLE